LAPNPVRQPALNFVARSAPSYSVPCAHGFADPRARDLIFALESVLVECTENFHASPLACKEGFPLSSLRFLFLAPAKATDPLVLHRFLR
jgi:hypothetical protein